MNSTLSENIVGSNKITNGQRWDKGISFSLTAYLTALFKKHKRERLIVKCQCQETLLVLHVCPIARKITPKNVNCRCTFKLKLLLAAGYSFSVLCLCTKVRSLDRPGSNSSKETKVMEVKAKNLLRLSYLYIILSRTIYCSKCLNKKRISHIELFLFACKC